MCGRFYIDADGLQEYAPEKRIEGEGLDICPGMEAPVLTDAAQDAPVSRMRWGFERPGGGLVINARIETIDEKPMFRQIARSQRCAMPATRYYEWRRADRQKYDVALRDARLFWLAGLYRLGTGGAEFVVLTQPPVPTIQRIHNRMPLILPTIDGLERWLAGETPRFEDDSRILIRANGPEQLSMRF